MVGTNIASRPSGAPRRGYALWGAPLGLGMLGRYLPIRHSPPSSIVTLRSCQVGIVKEDVSKVQMFKFGCMAWDKFLLRSAVTATQRLT